MASIRGSNSPLAPSEDGQPLIRDDQLDQQPSAQALPLLDLQMSTGTASNEKDSAPLRPTDQGKQIDLI